MSGKPLWLLWSPVWWMVDSTVTKISHRAKQRYQKPAIGEFSGVMVVSNRLTSYYLLYGHPPPTLLVDQVREGKCNAHTPCCLYLLRISFAWPCQQGCINSSHPSVIPPERLAGTCLPSTTRAVAFTAVPFTSSPYLSKFHLCFLLNHSHSS